MIEGQQGVTWRDWCALADACERLGFEGLFRSDHYFSARGVSGRGATDAWTLLGGLAARTSRIRLGTLVSPVTFRPPALLAKAATTVDEISEGRVEVGMGAGWWEEEHTQFGFPFFDVHERWARLEEAVPIVHGLWTQERFSFEGTYYRLHDAEFLPKPVQHPHPPLILGGKAVGARMQRLIGRYADEFNTVGGLPEEVAGRFARARGGFESEGRDPSSLGRRTSTSRSSIARTRSIRMQDRSRSIGPRSNATASSGRATERPPASASTRRRASNASS